MNEDNELDECYLTVGELRNALEGLPDGMPVYYERIEDSYFDVNGWTTREMLFEYDSTAEYIRAFGSYHHKKEDVFVINANY